MVCDTCVSTVKNFIFFCDHVEKFQNKLFNVSHETDQEVRTEKNLVEDKSEDLTTEAGECCQEDQFSQVTVLSSDESLLVPMSSPVNFLTCKLVTNYEFQICFR